MCGLCPFSRSLQRRIDDLVYLASRYSSVGASVADYEYDCCEATATSLAATHLAGFNGELMPFTLCTCAYRTHVHTFHGSLGLTLCIPDSLSLWEDVPLDCKFRVRFPSHRGVQRRATDASWITCQAGSQVFADSC